MTIASMDFEEETKGKWTNRKIKKMELAEGSQPNPPPEAQTDTTDASEERSGPGYVNHGDVLLGLMTMAGGAAVDRSVFLTLIAEFKIGLDALLAPPEKGKITNDNEPHGWGGPDGDPAEDDLPF